MTDKLANKKITLLRPVTIDGKKRTSITVQRPKPTDLFDIKMELLINSDVDEGKKALLQCASFEDGAPMVVEHLDQLNPTDFFFLIAAFSEFSQHIELDNKHANTTMPLLHPFKMPSENKNKGKLRKVINIQRPSVPNLSGLNMADVLKGHVTTMIALLQRCATYADGSEVGTEIMECLDFADLFNVCRRFTYFLDYPA